MINDLMLTSEFEILVPYVWIIGTIRHIEFRLPLSFIWDKHKILSFLDNAEAIYTNGSDYYILSGNLKDQKVWDYFWSKQLTLSYTP